MEPLPVRRQRVGLPPERADVIVFGTAIYDAALRVLGCIPKAMIEQGQCFREPTKSVWEEERHIEQPGDVRPVFWLTPAP